MKNRRVKALFLTMMLSAAMTAGACGNVASASNALGAVSVSAAESTASAAESTASEEKSTASGAESTKSEAESLSATSESLEAESVKDVSYTPATITPFESLDLADMFSNKDQDDSWSETTGTVITLSGKTAAVKGSGAEAEGNTVTISTEGTYILSGEMTDGQIVIEAGEQDKVHLVLNGVNMTNDDSACIFVKSADKVIVTLADGTENILSDTGETFTQPDEGSTVDGVIFSREDLSFNGKGTLTVKGTYSHAIVCKDDLVIAEGTYVIEATDKGLVGEDSVRVKDGDLTITSGDDAVHSSTSDKEGKGFIYIEGGKFLISAGDDGIHAETALVIAGGTICVTESKEGLEGATIDVLDGDIDITSSDDGINAAYSSTTSADGSALNGAKTQEEMTSPEMNGEMPEGMTPPEMNGEIPEGMTPPEINGEMPEGMTPPEMNGEMPEGMTPSERNGETQEGWNGMQRPKGGRGGVCGQNGTMQGGGFGDMMDVQADAYLRIAGGDIYINAGGDALDANGYFYMEGGTVLADGPTGSGNGTIDAAIAAKVTGGTIIAVGSAGMAQSFGSDSTQYSINYTFANAVEAGTALTLTDETGKVVATASPAKTYQNVVISTPEIGNGTYTLTAGDQSESIVVESISTSAGSSLGSAGFGGRR